MSSPALAGGAAICFDSNDSGEFNSSYSNSPSRVGGHNANRAAKALYLEEHGEEPKDNYCFHSADRNQFRDRPDFGRMIQSFDLDLSGGWGVVGVTKNGKYAAGFGATQEKAVSHLEIIMRYRFKSPLRKTIGGFQFSGH